MTREGLVGNVRQVASDGLRMLRTRLELLMIEVQEQKALVVRQVIVAAATLFFAAFGMQLLILWLVLSLDEGRRQAVLGGIGVAFAIAAVAGALYLKTSGKLKPLAGTLAVLKGDEDALRGALARNAPAASGAGDD